MNDIEQARDLERNIQRQVAIIESLSAQIQAMQAVVEAARAIKTELGIWQRQKADGWTFDPDGADVMLIEALAALDKQEKP